VIVAANLTNIAPNILIIEHGVCYCMCHLQVNIPQRSAISIKFGNYSYVFSLSL